MIWLSLVIALLQAIPDIIDLIKLIVDLIHGHPFQLQYEMKLHSVLWDWKTHQDEHRVRAELGALHAEISASAGKPLSKAEHPLESTQPKQIESGDIDPVCVNEILQAGDVF